MNLRSWQRVKSIVADALELPETERKAFVRRASGDDAILLREADSLLEKSGERVENFADDLSSTLVGAEASARANERLGAYEIVRELGRGGMGVVYLARRADETFEKQVAIKILKRGTDTDEVLRRFRAERQILARLEHPNIARLLDAGTTEDGLPYFVMERIEGVPITDFYNSRGLKNDERVRLFLQVCDAIQFAHRNLIVHRDIKPGNILMTAEGQPKLLDFGIAKLLEAEGETVLVTIENRQRLTPGYASPEQVRGEAITTVSDVYSLGALLHELLTGKSPHRFATATPSPTELQRVIAEQEISRTNLTSDLDNILRTALRKEPERRYSGVTAFSDDLRRYLEGRPVQARPSTLAYRASKFIARNKLGVAAAILLLLTLLGGMAATARQAAIAQRRFNDVRKLAHAVVFDYHDLVAPLRGATPVRERLVKDAIEYLDNLSREAGADRGLLREMATAYDKVGRVQGNSYFPNLGDTEGALRSYRRSLELRERLLARAPHDHELQDEVAKSYAGVGDVLYSKDDLRGALASYEKGVEVRLAGLRAAGDDILPYQLELVVLYSRIGDVKGMEQYANLGDTAGALASLRQALEILERLQRDHPENSDVNDQLANALTHAGMLACTAGDAASGLAMERRALELVEKLAATNPNSQSFEMSVLVAKHWLRLALEDHGKTDEAIAISRQVVDDLQRLSQGDPKNIQVRRNLAVARDALGKQLLVTGDHGGALEAHREALASFEQLANENGLGEFKADIALSTWRTGRAHAVGSDQTAAIEYYRKALALREPVIASDSANSRARDDVASIYVDLGRALAATKDFAGAEEAFRKALPLAEMISAQAPTSARLRAHLAHAYAEAGRAALAAGDTDETRVRLGKSHEIWSELREKGIVLPADATKPEEVARELEKL